MLHAKLYNAQSYIVHASLELVLDSSSTAHSSLDSINSTGASTEKLDRNSTELDTQLLDAQARHIESASTGFDRLDTT